MRSESDNYQLKTKMKSFHCGQRFKELCRIHRLESPTFWMKALGVADRSSVYYRWENDKLDCRELVLICSVLNISLYTFMDINNDPNAVNEPPVAYKRQYIEELMEELQARISSLEKDISKLTK